MRIEQLKYLVDIAETKSMSKTAERLFVSTQTVSKSIKQLESELGAELLRRTNAGVVLTPVGDSIAALAENVLREVQQMHQIVEENSQTLQQEYSLSLRICSTSAITNIVLPNILGKYAAIGINIIPHIDMVNSAEEVLERVENGDCGIGLLTYNEEELFRIFTQYKHTLEMNLLARDEQVVVMDVHQYQAGQDFVSVRDFQGRFCTMFSIIPVESRWQGSLLNHVTHSNDADFHRAMIKSANAYVLMPRLAYQHFFNSKSYMALPLEGVHIPMIHAAVYRKDAPKDLQNFISLIRVNLQ
ncbi:MAG: LysR family transcriptional regulator [Peptococcaceae bacterium]|nr:LysR family transcriptional regulator [Peptococcaceae bacterium]